MARKPLITPGSLLPPSKEAVPDLMLRVIERDREKSGRRGDSPSLPFVTEEKPARTGDTESESAAERVGEGTRSNGVPAQGANGVSARVHENRDGEKSEYSEHITGNMVIRLPESGFLDHEAIERIKEKVAHRTKAVTFKLDAGLDEYVSDWVSARWRDRCQKQDVLKRALMLWMYEQETGVRLVDFGDEANLPIQDRLPL